MFDLLLDKKRYMFEETEYRGKITVDDFEEYFFSSDSFFKKEDYYRHWLKSVGLLFKYSKAFFLKNVYDPHNSNFCMSWECHLLNGVVYVQDTILFSEDCHLIDDDDGDVIKYCLRDVIYSSVEIGDIIFADDEGNKVLTWQTDVKSINDFKKRLEKGLQENHHRT